MEGKDQLWVPAPPSFAIGSRLTDFSSLRLASHLYSEHLLHQDHYLDWLMKSLEDSDLDSIPIWLLVLQIHRQELLEHRQRGRRLAGAVLGHLHKVSGLKLGLNQVRSPNKLLGKLTYE